MSNKYNKQDFLSDFVVVHETTANFIGYKLNQNDMQIFVDYESNFSFFQIEYSDIIGFSKNGHADSLCISLKNNNNISIGFPLTKKLKTFVVNISKHLLNNTNNKINSTVIKNI